MMVDMLALLLDLKLDLWKEMMMVGWLDSL